jgi:hypothetical protein
MKAQYTTAFEQMVLSMRQRLRPTTAHLFADRLRTCVGLNCSRIDETRLLKMLLQEVSPSRSLAEELQSVLKEGPVAERPVARSRLLLALRKIDRPSLGNADETGTSGRIHFLT